MRVRDDLDFQCVSELLAYNAVSGDLTWRVARGRMPAMSIAGQVSSYGYRQIRLFGKLYMAHRLAYLLYHGEWPDESVDHYDRDKLNNSISNLRPCSWIENATNVGKQSTNTSGYQGVSFKNGRWRACLRVEGRHKHLGSFDCPAEAHKAYVRAKKEHHPFWNNLLPESS